MPASILGENCQEYYTSVFSDNDETNWCLLSYNGNTLVGSAKGEGGIQELVNQFVDTEVMYALLRMTKTDDCGDSVRTKFVFLIWVGPQASPLKRGKVNGHKPIVGDLFKGYHIDKAIYERRELVGLEGELDILLKKAGGANYDLGNTRSGISKGVGAAQYKAATREFFEAKERETKIGPVVYHKGPLKEGLTPCDLQGRPMTVGQSKAKENIVDEWSLHKKD